MSSHGWWMVGFLSHFILSLVVQATRGNEQGVQWLDKGLASWTHTVKVPK